jgi:hypothetical protein
MNRPLAILPAAVLAFSALVHTPALSLEVTANDHGGNALDTLDMKFESLMQRGVVRAHYSDRPIGPVGRIASGNLVAGYERRTSALDA